MNSLDTSYRLSHAYAATSPQDIAKNDKLIEQFNNIGSAGVQAGKLGHGIATGNSNSGSLFGLPLPIIAALGIGGVLLLILALKK